MSLGVTDDQSDHRIKNHPKAFEKSSSPKIELGIEFKMQSEKSLHAFSSFGGFFAHAPTIGYF